MMCDKRYNKIIENSVSMCLLSLESYRKETCEEIISVEMYVATFHGTEFTKASM